MIQLNLFLIFKEWLLPIFIAFFSVWIGAYVTRKHNEKLAERNEHIQREKILKLLRKETELFLKYQEEKDTFRSRKYLSLNLVIENPIFNIEEHERLIELVLELARIQDGVETSVLISSNLYANTISGYMKPDIPALLLTITNLIENIFKKEEGTIERLGKSVENSINRIIKDASLPAKEVLRELLMEIDSVIDMHGYNR
ncbi:hypothetical protein [Sutcliffiella cohnii]|uniref:hypothetical protein n=1 Tax=Sutcliffiella cohnii TaxID=33932 RepID=UPI002E20A784|nr:hypothetical protein [Sutcliffiella cohnii]